MSSPKKSSRRGLFLGVMLLVGNLACAGAGYMLAAHTAEAAEVDLAVTSASVSAVPFYELVFDDGAPSRFHKALVPDPLTKARPRPFVKENSSFGPHDAIGFRSRGTPGEIDVVTIGDSQTYGWGVPIDDNWPSQLSSSSGLSVYNMALGGWGGAQHLYMAEKAGPTRVHG